MNEKRTTLNRSIVLVVALVVAVAVLAVGYSWGRTHSDANGVDLRATAAKASATGHDADDVRFAQMMVPHHEQATEMATMAATQATSPAVKTLAAKIEAAQSPEIEKMNGWLKDWNVTSTMGSMKMDGMMSDADMATLSRTSGAAFDKMFLQMMVKHHEGAITMADSELAGGRSDDALALATSIVVSQQAEVNQMKDLLD